MHFHWDGLMRAASQLPVLIILAFLAGSVAGFYGSSLTETAQHDGSELRLERDELRDRLQREEARKQRLESELAQIAKVDFADYLQIYIFEKQGIIIGNFYDELPEGKVEHLGRLKLRR
jgi:hypothetical protein